VIVNCEMFALLVPVEALVISTGRVLEFPTGMGANDKLAGEAESVAGTGFEPLPGVCLEAVPPVEAPTQPESPSKAANASAATAQRTRNPSLFGTRSILECDARLV
jgi:hypothetical protein